VHPSTDQPARRFAPGSSVLTDDARTLVVVAARPHSGRYLVRWHGVRTREDAEALRHTRLWVDVAAAAGEADEGFYDADLVGLEVRDPAGTVVGQVTAVEHGPAQDLLVVRTATGGTARVPFVTALVPVVSVEQGWVQIDPPPGLLTLEE
jgi:16S rRNA processing protein RimM